MKTIYCLQYRKTMFLTLLHNNQSINSQTQDKLAPYEIGDSIGGILNPLIGFCAVIVTFLAFYIQFLANRAVSTQFKLQQFESQFFEMLRLHKENVNEITKFTLIDNKLTEVRGRAVFNIYIQELSDYYKNAKKIHPNDPKKRLNKAYGYFFHGMSGKKKITVY